MKAHTFLGDLASILLTLWSNFFDNSLPAKYAQPVIGTITTNDFLAAAAIVVTTIILHVVIGVILNRRAKVAKSVQKETKQHVFLASTKPLYLLLWTFGAYLAVDPLLGKLPGKAAVGKEIFDQLLDIGVCVAVIWFLMRLTRILEVRLAAWAEKSQTRLDDLLVPLVGKALRTIIPVMGIIFVLPLLNLPTRYADTLATGSSILVILAVTAILFETVNVGQKAALDERDLKKADNLRARSIYTQVKLLSKTVHVIIGLCSVASILMLFPQVRHVGSSLLASAGIAGIIAGIAAQQTLANLFAGFQIAMTQPIRQDDVVIVEGEWGRIEEISLTYVVVHIWDDRRLILPLSYFIQKPFQNWTRVSAQLLGSVFVWVDYSFPVEAGRKALKDIIESNPLWDKRFWNLQVTDTSEKTMQLRILATSEDSSKSWDLRCKVREDFIAFIKDKYPECLPRFRAELDNAPKDRSSTDVGPIAPVAAPE